MRRTVFVALLLTVSGPIWPMKGLRDSPAYAMAADAVVFVLGQVRSPGPYPYKDGMTIKDVVERAGGLTPRADPNAIRISRVVDGRRTWLEAAFDTPVQAGDAIEVQRD